VVGTFQPTDPDVGETFTYTLVAGSGSNDNASFRINGANLETVGSFNFESRSLYRIRVRVTDSGGFTLQQAFLIDVTDVNEAPSDLTLSNTFLPENEPAGTLVGTLAYADPDIGGGITFALVNGTGSDDNARFALSGDRLLTTAPFDFETQSTFSILVRATDDTGLSIERNFTITLRNVNEPPIDVFLTNDTVLERLPAGSAVGDRGAIDQDPGEGFTFALVAGEGDAGNPFFVLDGTTLRTAGPLDFEAASTLTVRVQATDIEPFRFGLPGWIPVVGDWDGDGITGIGMVDPATGMWYLRNTPSAGPVDIAPFLFGLPGWIPVTGDWNGDGVHSVGTFDPSTGTWFMRNTPSAGVPDIVPFRFGLPGWTPVVGDWEGNTTSTVGVVDPEGNCYLHVANTSGFPIVVRFTYGTGDWVPLAGTYSLPTLRTLEVGPNAGLTPLDPGLLGGVVTAALPRLAAEGIDAATLDQLSAAQVLVTDLPGTLLGLADTAGNRIWIDSEAAGWGWFVDQTPGEDSEFASGVQGMDLLSVVAHELGHLAGLGHSQDEDALMGDVLLPGQRRVQALDAVFTLGM
jgi:hypothetical protein